MFEDKRSKKVILLSHCILNQNAKVDRCAHYPGAVQEIVEIIIHSGMGIVQMPCPELLLMGLDRQVDRANQPTIEAEDTRIAVKMSDEDGKSLCEEIAINLVYQIEEYRKNGFEVAGLIGINGSPTCGVEQTWFDDREQNAYGALIQALDEKLKRIGVTIPMIGIKVYEPQQAIARVNALLDGSKR